MLSSLWALAVILVPVVQGSIHQIYVGDQNGSKIYTPTTVEADVNDTVIFIFLSNHTVTETQFSTPCLHAAASSFDSGFLAAGHNYSVNVVSTDPVWIRCSGHCSLGMVAAINADKGSDTFAQFQANALATNTSSSTATSMTSTTYRTSSLSTTTTTSRGAATPRFLAFGPATIISGIFALIMVAVVL